MSELKSYYGLPRKVKFCKKCVISNQRPSSAIEFKNKKNDKKKVIHFDENQICSACRFNKLKEEKINWSNREQNLKELLSPKKTGFGNLFLKKNI